MSKLLKKTLALILSLVLMLTVCTVAFATEDGTPFEDSKYYTQGDYEIHYRVISAKGEMKGRILFIHGFLYSTETWNGVASIMAENGYECVLADLPNYGYSTRENDDIEQIDREDLMVGLMESIAPLEEWIVAGHSMGGGVAANIACEHSEIKALMLYAPAAQVQSASAMTLAKNDGIMNIMQKIANMILKMKFVVKICVRMASGDKEYAENYDTDILTKPLMQDGTVQGIMYQSATAKSTDFVKLATLEMPVLLVWAGDDSVLETESTDKINEALKGKVTLATVDGGHIFIESRPQKTAEITLNFLDGIEK